MRTQLKRHHPNHFIVFGCIMALVALALVACGLGLFVDHLRQNAEQRAAECETRSLALYRPPVDQCPDGVELWDCIRHALYREDM